MHGHGVEAERPEAEEDVLAGLPGHLGGDRHADRAVGEDEEAGVGVEAVD